MWSLDYRHVVETIPALIFSSRVDGYIDFFNQRCLDFIGAPFEAAQGFQWIEFIHPDDRDAHLQRWKTAITTGQPAMSEARLRNAKGEYRWMLYHTEPYRDQSGTIVRWLGTAVDIEHAKRAEQDLRTIIDTIPAVVWTAHPNGAIDFISGSWLQRTGLTKDDLVDFEFKEVLHPDERDAVVARWEQTVAAGTPHDEEVRIRMADGAYRWHLMRAVPLRDGSAGVVRWYGTITDVDDRKRAERELHDLKEQLYKENIALRDEVSQTSMFEEIVGSSEPLRRVLVLVAKVAATDSTVLITGETGTGKELVARAIHKRSPRKSKPFVSVNCGAIPQSLIASELFGHEKGAFTGAMERRLGRFELAEGGTIFLDEVGDLPQETQIALLRVLQERAFERVGSTKSIPVDVHVIAATNRDLDKAIEDGSFRADLYYRLSVFPIALPALRERQEDIPLLVEYLARRYAAKAGKKITSVSRRTIDMLTAYDWPGNVRELQNIIQRAVILSEETLIVDETWLAKRQGRRTPDGRGLGRPTTGQEKTLIEKALDEARGRVAGQDGAAAKLGIPRSTLESKIRSLNINKHRFKSD